VDHFVARDLEKFMADSKHEPKVAFAGCPPESSDTTFASQLESIYSRYGQGIYTLCLRLMANEKAAESATVDVFVKFSKEMASHSDESLIRLRLCELAINASLARLNRRGGMIMR
jgi:hypothetical protein